MKRLIWDIETAPCVGYFWKPGHQITIGYENIIRESAVICISYKWEDDPYVYSLTWDGDWNDRAMINTFRDVAVEADELVAHFGDSFDLPWFQSRLILHGLEPIPKLKTVDTCKLARKNFRLNSYKLDYLGKLWYNEAKLKTDYSLWKSVCEGNKKALAYMVEYCEADVYLLERVWKKLQPYVKAQTHAGVLAGGHRWSCEKCASEEVKLSKTRVSAAGIKTYQMNCKDCGRYFSICETVFKKYQERSK